MIVAKKIENVNAKDVLMAFSQYGFRKTSMEDIASAAGMSRQSIYKKFGSKEKCYEWTINTYLAGMYARIFSTLDNQDVSPSHALLKVFDILIGEAVEIVSNLHGTEILDDVLKATHSSKEDYPLRFRTRLAEFLERNDYVSKDQSIGMAFALISAGKGLLLEESSREQFLEDMKFILESVVTHKR